MEHSSVTYEQVASALEAHAAAGQTISYNDFADEVGLPRPNNLFANSALKAYFEQIDAHDSIEQSPFLTAVVVQKSSWRPGKGFYDSLRLLRGIDIPPAMEIAVWETELADVFDYYKPGQPTASLTIELTRAQHGRLLRLSERAERSAQVLVESGITGLLDYLEREFTMIERAHDDIEHGRFVSHEEVRARFNL